MPTLLRGFARYLCVYPQEQQMDSKTLTASVEDATDMKAPADSQQLSWYAEAGPRARRAFWTCKVGYMLDGMETQMLSFVIPTLVAIWGISLADAGFIGTMTWLGFPLGFFASGIFSGMGAFLTELFPTRVRGSGQGFCYNIGRATGALFPVLIGALSSRFGLGTSIGIFAVAAYGVLIIAALTLPETRGRGLESA